MQGESLSFDKEQVKCKMGLYKNPTLNDTESI